MVVADTGPINYLVLIGQIDLLPNLFGPVIVPREVFRELIANRAPPSVQQWIASSPAWLEIRDVPLQPPRQSLSTIDAGERAAIQLALSLDAELVLMDDRRGVSAAERLGLRVIGKIGVLDLAAERKLINFSDAIQQLRGTNFHRPEALLNVLLNKHAGSDA